MKTYLYFQPEYVREFVCDGSKCDARCCKGWNIDIDAKTYAQYERIQPAVNAEEILSHIVSDAEQKTYCVTLDDKNFCPFLTEKNLCRLQLEYGENFLSKTCSTYPRRTFDFGKFFEQSLSLSCPVAAELILLRNEPLKFELVELSEREHSRGGKLKIDPVNAKENLVERMLEIQIAMISILQERTLTIDQRLIVLGFFLDRLDEIICGGFDKGELKKLIVAYESKSFLSEQVPRMLASVHFNAEKFIASMPELLAELYTLNLGDDGRKFLAPLVETFKIFPDKNNRIFVANIADNYTRLAEVRKIFTARYSTFLENYLVNEIFSTGFPWKLKVRVPKNFAVLATEYKFFELSAFATVQKGFGKVDLLALTGWFVSLADHGDRIAQKLLGGVSNDVFDTLENLLEP